MKEEPPESQPPPRKRFRWLRREGIDLGDAVVQFIAVLLGVLFALLISQWNDHRQQQAKAQAAMRQQQAEVHEAMHAMGAELVANRTELRRNAEDWYKVATVMMDSPKNQNQPLRQCYQWAGWSGYGPALLTDAAYQTAIATQALAHMPFKQAHLVARVYGFQNSYHGIFDPILKTLAFGRPQTLDECVESVEELGFHDRLLARQYAPFIGPIKAKWSTSPPNPVQPNTTK